MNTRAKILHELRTAPDWISGQLISRKMGISRAAISKQIAKLQQDGYRIEAVPHRGYKLVYAPDRLCAEEVLAICPASPAKKISYHHKNSTESTNIDARLLADGGAPEYTLVVAESQTGGRGRQGREWISPPETGIYATILLRPKLPPEDAPLLTLLAAVVSAEAIISATSLQPTIKWPNDILLNGKKTAGILTEISTGPDCLDYALIGFGINVNTPRKLLPRRPIFPASSLAAEAGQPFSRAGILAAWLKIFAVEYKKLMRGERDQLLEHWLNLSGIVGQSVTVRRINDMVSGTVSGIDSTGALLIKTADGSIRTILSGDIVKH